MFIKKINKKLGYGFLAGFLFVLLIPIYLLAVESPQESYSATKATSTGSVVNATSRTGEPYKIINYSSNSYFIPNKTQPEFGSFLNNSPRYTFYSKCGDGVCLPGELLETPENCLADCAGKHLYKFCGDGRCSLKTSCIGTIYDCRSLPGDGEDYFNCPADCQAPTSIAACGVCGTYFDGGVEKICPNSCDQNRVSLVNCIRPSNVVTYYGDGIIQLFSKIFNKDVKSAGMWYCNPDLSNACPAGKYCGLTGTTAETPQDCWAGYFCPKGSVRPQICPPGYYSAPASATCTACPSYTYSAPGASNISHCYQLDVCGDETCEGNENPRNCPQDCSIPNDGLCTGTETHPDSNDCYCGNNNCDKGESPISCIDDCHCGDGVCNYFEHNETPASCSADCYYGNNTCDMGETYKSSYPNDCKCGNGNCDLGENWNNCSSDCTCGNGVCNTGENYLNCLLDCPRCGNGICDTGVSIVTTDGQIQPVKPETALSFGANYDHCSADCRCGDGICDASESTTCTLDCGCGNGVCTSPTETPLNCRYDCGSCGDGVCAYHYGKIELNDATGLSSSIYHSCPGDCTGTTGSIKKPFMPLE